MDDSLPLPLPVPVPPALVDGPFTRTTAAAVGVDRPALERMIRAGVVRRMLRGVYVDACQPDSAALRARALALVVPARSVVVDRTAGWLHGLDREAGLPPPTEVGLDVLGRRGRLRHFGVHRPLAARDVMTLGGVRTTTPVRTALDLARLLAPDRALATLDATLRAGWCDQVALVAELARLGRLPGGRRLRGLVGLADHRARTPVESVLRLRWLDSGLPTPVLGLSLASGRVRLTLALPAERFAAVVGDAPAVSGWWLVRLAARRVLQSDARLVEEHLRREYHRHLLGRAG
jgi:putative AbiEi antitoxin of type IV toxin-antitoxin system